MPRPENKADLLALSHTNLHKLLAFIESLPEELRHRSFENQELNDRDKTIADVVCHLHAWHNLLQGWYQVGVAGKKPAIPGEGITWQTLPILNRRIHAQYEGTPLSVALELLNRSHTEMTSLIASHSDEELFTRKRYSWTGSTSVGAYCISATSSHYDWALKVIKPLKKLS